MQRNPHKLWLIVVTTALLAVGTISPAGAETTTDKVSDVKVDVRPTDVRPTDVRPDIEPRIEVLKLRCRGRIGHEGVPGVKCKWTRPTVDGAKLVVLERNSGDGFAPIWRTTNLRRNRYFDEKVEPGARYRYRVRVYNAEKELVAASRANGAHVPVADIDILKIHCKGAVSDTGDKTAACEWSPSEEARGYQLWRIVNRGHRELVGTYGADTQMARDDVPEDAAVVRYAVLALDNEGEIIGRSRVVKVRFLDNRVD